MSWLCNGLAGMFMVTVMTKLFDVSLISVYITRSMGAIIYLLGGGYFYTRTHARLGIRLYPGGGV